jgi:hypothetical protein
MAHIFQLVLGVFMRSIGVKAAPSLWKHMSAISNVEKMKA